MMSDYYSWDVSDKIFCPLWASWWHCNADFLSVRPIRMTKFCQRGINYSWQRFLRPLLSRQRFLPDSFCFFLILSDPSWFILILPDNTCLLHTFCQAGKAVFEISNIREIIQFLVLLAGAAAVETIISFKTSDLIVTFFKRFESQ